MKVSLINQTTQVAFTTALVAELNRIDGLGLAVIDIKYSTIFDGGTQYFTCLIIYN